MGTFVWPFAGKQVGQQEIDIYFQTLKKSLTLIEKYWLSDTSKPYLIGHELTLADLSAACEAATLLAMGSILPRSFNFQRDYPRTYAWLKRVLTSHRDIEEINGQAIKDLKQMIERFNARYDGKL